MHDNILSNIPNSKALTLVDYPFVFNGLVNHNLISYKAFEYYEVSENIKYESEGYLILESLTDNSL